MTRLLLLVILICSQISHASGDPADTLKSRRADSILSRAYAIFYSNPDSSQYYTSLALDYAQKNNLEVHMAKAWHSMARTEVLRGDIELALKHLKDAVAVFERHKQPQFEAKGYVLMSTALTKLDNHREAVRLLLKACGIQKRIKNKTGLRSTLVNLANSYSKLHEFDKALDALNESKQYAVAGDNQWFYYYINAGIIQKNKKNYALAKIQFDSCLAISHRHKMVDAEVTAITDLAELYATMKQPYEAVGYFKEAIKMARANHLPLEETEALTGLMNCYESTGDYKNAFDCQNRLKVISDSLFNIEKIKNITTVEAKLKVSEKERTIALQKLDMEKNAAEQEKSNKRILLLIAGSTFLVMVLFFTIYIYLKVKRQKKEVEQQKARAERLNSLNQKIFAVIAHDFKSPMITLNTLIDLMDKENVSGDDLKTYSSDVRNQIIQSGQILDNLLNWAKTELNLSYNTNLYSNPSLIVNEISKELNYMAARKNIRIVNQVPESILFKVPPDILKIILRNLLSNAIKFSFSDNEVVVGLNDKVTLFVKDVGAGMNEKTINHLFNGTVQSKLGTFNETGFGLGLYITHELINKFNGSIWVEKNNPTGTIFKFVFPTHARN